MASHSSTLAWKIPWTAKKLKGVSASDISKAERGELKLTNETLKKIAKATGVTQKSLTDAAASSTYSGKSGKTGKTSSTKPKQTSTKPKQTSTSTGSKTSMQVTATEKKLVQLYRKADADAKKKAMAALKGTDQETIFLQAVKRNSQFAS